MGYNSHGFVPNTYFSPDQIPMSNGFHQSIVYVYEPSAGHYHYGPGHPMKPYRLALTHDLVFHYGLAEYMTCFRGRPAFKTDFLKFHDEEYVDFLTKVSNRETMVQLQELGKSFNIGDDCPLFEGLYTFCSLYTGSSLDAAKYLINGTADIAINWSGGLHHAKRSEASGFCYINDIILAIIEMLRFYPRVLYIDIDVHHGDGVQEAFYLSDRVMTLSFHKYGDGFFPGTGSLFEVGFGKGAGFSINVPLLDGIDDSSYHYVFQPIAREAILTFGPSVIVLQCGADSLEHDRLGRFNLSIAGHGQCIQFVKSFNIPMLVLGGGGYTPRNVSRAWTYETGLLCNIRLDNNLPVTSPHLDYFGPEFKLLSDSRPGHKRLSNQNTRKYLEDVLEKVLSHIRALQGAPSIQLQVMPSDYYDGSYELEPQTLDSIDPDHWIRSAPNMDSITTKVQAYQSIYYPLILKSSASK